MLQIISILFIVLFSSSVLAQSAPGNIPAFLRNEATRAQYQQQIANQPNANEPAFLRKEREEQMQYQQTLQQIESQQNQYQYQSADPNSQSFTLPPATYQPAQGDVPAFVQQGADPNAAPEQDQPALRTNKKEDVIQINFSDDQYKPEEEITPLNNADAKEYNTEIQKNNEEANATSELQEGAKYETAVNRQKLDAEKMSQNSVSAPDKSTSNLIRITYNKEDIELSEDDKKALAQAVAILKEDKNQKIMIKSFTSDRDLKSDTRRIGLLRVVNIRDYMMKQGIDFSRTDVKLIEPELNKEDLDYIDIDKI